MINFKDSFYFPFIRFNRLSYFLFILIPVIGVFEFLGYCYNLLREIVSDQYISEPPKLTKVGRNIFDGIIIVGFIIIWFYLLLLILFIPYIGFYLDVLFIFLIPISLLDLVQNRSLLKCLNLFRIIHTLVNNILDYIVTWAKFIIFTLFYGVLSIPIITGFLTIPAWIYTSSYLFGDFFKYAEIWEQNKETEEKVVDLITKTTTSHTIKGEVDNTDYEKEFEELVKDVK